MKFIHEKDRKLWKKIKRNGNFTKKKKAMIQEAKKSKTNKCNPIENCALNIESGTSPTLNNNNLPEIFSNLNQSVNFAEIFEGRSNNVDEVDSDNDDADEAMEKQDMLAFREEVKHWAIIFQIKHVAINALLNILKSHIPDNVLPKDARTLVGTPRNTNIKTDKNIGGEYWHYGLQKVLENTFTPFENIPSELSLNVNIDGLPTFKSSTTSFWPILVNVHEMSQNISPMIVGIFCGECKYC